MRPLGLWRVLQSCRTSSGPAGSGSLVTGVTAMIAEAPCALVLLRCVVCTFYASPTPSLSFMHVNPWHTSMPACRRLGLRYAIGIGSLLTGLSFASAARKTWW